MVFNGNVLGADDLLGGHGKKGPSFHRGIIHNQHEQAAMNVPQAGDYARRGSAAPLFIHLISGIDAQFEKFSVPVNEQADALTGSKTSFTVLRLDAFFPAALPYPLLFIADGRDKLHHAAHVPFKPSRGKINLRCELIELVSHRR